MRTVVDAGLQIELAARRAGLDAIFGGLEFDQGDVELLAEAREGEEIEVRFSNEHGPVGVLFSDVFDGGDPEDKGLTVGLRGWRLHEGIASV